MDGITKLLPPAVRQQLYRSDSSLLELLTAVWANMVGRGIAKQCRPVAFAAGTLTIATSCPTWAVQFRQLGEEIRTSINRFLGEEPVKRLRVRIDPTAEGLALPEIRRSKPDAVCAADDGPRNSPSLDRDVSGVVRQSYSKYFARTKGNSH